MPATPHIEKHFTASETIRDIVIGMSDGLTVPFALAAGLTGAVASTSVVVTAGLAEVAAGAIAACQDGRTHTLTDNHGIRHENVLMLAFEFTTPIQAGRGLWVDYSIEYLQLP